MDKIKVWRLRPFTVQRYRHCAVMPQYVVCLSVTFRYRYQLSHRLEYFKNNFTAMLRLTPTWAIWCKGNTPKLGWNGDGVMSTKTCNISETVQDRTKVTMMH